MSSKFFFPCRVQHHPNSNGRHIWEALRQIWPDAHWPGQHQVNFVESRL